MGCGGDSSLVYVVVCLGLGVVGVDFGEFVFSNRFGLRIGSCLVRIVGVVLV